MRKTFLHIIHTMLIVSIVCACNDNLDITQDYAFDLQVMPYPARIVRGETVEIRCQLVKEGNYKDAQYYIRYFQTEGTGELRLDDDCVLTPNDLFLLENDVFRLYYTSQCTDRQNITVYIQDSFGQVVQKSFNFQNENGKTEEPVSLKFTLETLPVPKSILLNDTVEIRFQIVKEDARNTSVYSIRYFQPEGKGTLLLGDTVLKPNDLYPLDDENFNLYYVSDSAVRQTIDVYIVDSNGQTIQKTFSFENQFIEPEPEIDYTFEFESLPVPKSVIEGETVEIRCHIKRADSRNDTDYFIRYFQLDGKGELRLADGAPLVPNDLYRLENDVFRLYYTSHSADLQTIDIYIVDSFGKVVKKTFGFTGIPVNEPDDDPEDETDDDPEEDGGDPEEDTEEENG
jgi:hypothetical protein